jgi:hypothetical protein
MQQAVKIHHILAIARAAYGSVYVNIDELDRATEGTTRDWNIRDRASERERSYCTTPLRSGLSLRSVQAYMGTPILIRPCAAFARDRCGVASQDQYY